MEKRKKIPTFASFSHFHIFFFDVRYFAIYFYLESYSISIIGYLPFLHEKKGKINKT